ncbi:MAG: hypothetical protein CFE44_12765 [Burkholderiales bacterium PBB4]|nr:MAG: hypothetical protein CFE44_12765 [Burkholderiales bacterium PBB4]
MNTEHNTAPNLPLPPTQVSPWWRVATYALLIVLATAVTTTLSMFEQFKAQIGHLQTQLKTTPQIRFVAVLLDDKSAPALLVTQDPQEGALQLQRLNAVKEGREDSMQLWALVPGQPPQSLGVITSKAATMRLPAKAEALEGATSLAISVEDKGGVDVKGSVYADGGVDATAKAGPMRGPRLPYLFQGALVRKAL